MRAAMEVVPSILLCCKELQMIYFPTILKKNAMKKKHNIKIFYLCIFIVDFLDLQKSDRSTQSSHRNNFSPFLDTYAHSLWS